MDKYRIYTDRDDDIWLGYQNKLAAYEKIDYLAKNLNRFLCSEDRNVEDIKDRWDLELIHEHEDPNTLFTEAKLILLLRD